MSNSIELRVLPGDPDAEAVQPSQPWGVLEAYRAELDYICRTLLRLGIRAADVEDLAHEVFLVLCRKWGAFDQRRDLKPYLFGIAFRIAAAQRRRYGREVSCEALDVVDGARSAEQKLSSEEARATVLRALEHLPLPRRAVLIMYELDEIPMASIASTLRIPLFTAYSRLRKARREFERAVREVSAGSTP